MATRRSRRPRKVFVSVDLEGISGVVDTEQTNSTGKDYARVREWMTADANAVIQGALDGGATEVVVNDSHGSMRNLLYDQLHPDATLISGGGKPLSMLQGIDETFAVAFFVGYHARRGTKNAVLDHTYTGKPVDIRVNGTSFGETGLNAAVCGRFGVAVGLVTGCAALAEEAAAVLPGVLTVVVKEAVCRTAARCHPRAKVHEQLRETARKAAVRARSFPPLVLSPPVEIEIDFLSTTDADGAERVPGVERVAPQTIRLTGEDYLDLYRKLQLCV